MQTTPINITKPRTIIVVLLLISTAAFLLISSRSAVAQEGEGDVQQFSGRIEPGAGDIYRLHDLLEGEVLYWYAKGTSGNLDPISVLVEGDRDPRTTAGQFFEGVDEAIEAGEDPPGRRP